MPTFAFTRPPPAAVRDAADQLFQSVHSSVRALSRPAGIGVVNKHPLPVRLNLAYKQVVHNPVPEIRSEDLPRLGSQVDEADRAGGPIASGIQLGLEPDQLAGQVHLEPQCVGRAALVATAIQVRPVDLRCAEYRFLHPGSRLGAPLTQTTNVFVVVE